MGIVDGIPAPGGVAFKGDMELGWKANLWSRLAVRVLWRVGEGRYLVEGYRPVTFVQMMDTGMPGAEDEILRRLERWGIARALRQAGAARGDTIVFGDVELTWQG